MKRLTFSACYPVLMTWTFFGALASCRPADGVSSNPIEVGAVHWGRDFEAAMQASKLSGKPVMLLFQEIPGCSGCQEFGSRVLSDAALVALIEQHFVPLLIPNNKPGKDREILERYSEPAWNFQVVRFLSADGKDLIPRKDRDWTVKELATRMIAALEKADRPVPQELRGCAGGNAPRVSRVALAQACFWEGERKLGAIAGVVRTEAGFMDDREVTLVEYDPEKIALSTLVAQARQAGVADEAYVQDSAQQATVRGAGVSKVGVLNGRYQSAPASDQKRQIQGTVFSSLKLSPEQATKVNAYVRSDPQQALKFLSAEQRAVVSSSR